MSPYKTIRTETSGIRFSFAPFLNSVGYAANGIAFMLRSQRNARIHLLCSIAVIASGWWLQISAEDWRWLAVAMALVLMAESLNTAVEYLCDMVSPEYHPVVERAKDIGAGAVLICACGAAAVGVLTFWPYL